MGTRPQYKAKIGDFTTLPLYVLNVELKEDLQQFGKAPATIIKSPPDYHPIRYSPDAETLTKLGQDWSAAHAAIQSWSGHLSKFLYSIQFQADVDNMRLLALSDHTTTLSMLCDVRLALDPTALWSTFDSIASIVGAITEGCGWVS